MKELLRLAEQADTEGVPAEMDVPTELYRRQERLQTMARAKAIIEQRAVQRYAQEQKEYAKKVAQSQAKAEKTSKKPRGCGPQPPTLDSAEKIKSI